MPTEHNIRASQQLTRDAMPCVRKPCPTDDPSSSGSSHVHSTLSLCADLPRVNQRSCSLIQPHVNDSGLRRRNDPCPTRVVADIRSTNEVALKRFPLAESPIVPHRILTWMLAFANLLWTIYRFVVSAASCTHWTITTCIEHLRPYLDCGMHDEQESGRAKGFSSEEVYVLGNDAIPYLWPGADRGVGIPDRASRSKPREHHPSYMPREDTNLIASNASWPHSGGAYDPGYLEELYDLSSIDDLLLNEEHFAPGQDFNLSEPVLNGHNLPYILTELYPHPRPPLEGTHGSNPGGFEPMGPTDPRQPNQAFGAPIKTFPPHISSPADSRDDRHYCQAVPSMASVSQASPNVESSSGFHGSDPYNVGNSRRTRRPNMCGICGKEVRRPGVLEDHINSHTGQRRE
ncbi:hypothetical protein RHS03_07632, partial [Rhizoctonia solani]